MDNSNEIYLDLINKYDNRFKRLFKFGGMH